MTRSNAFVAIVTAVCLSACGGTETPAGTPAATSTAPAPVVESAPAPAAGSRIVFLGDSLTAGLGLAPDHAVPALIAARLRAEGYPYEVVNAGVSGDTSAGGVSRLDWALQGDVAILVLELGANDGLRGLPIDQMKQNLGTIIEAARARGITVLLTGMEAPPNYGEAYTTEFRQVYRDLARQYDVTFMPFFLEGVAGIPQLNNPDGIHPNPEGADIVANNIWQVLEPLLEKPRS